MSMQAFGVAARNNPNYNPQSTDPTTLLQQISANIKRIADVLDPPNKISLQQSINLQPTSVAAGANSFFVVQPPTTQGTTTPTEVRHIILTCSAGAIDALLSPDQGKPGDTTTQAAFTVGAGGLIDLAWNSAVVITLRNTSPTVAAMGWISVESW